MLLLRRACATLARSLPPHKLMPMPRLSPTMSSGALVRWHVVEGQPLPDAGMEPTCDVLPVGLTDDADVEADPPTLVIESHEEGFVARILLAEGHSAAPDEAIAVICEREEDIETVRAAYDALGDSGRKQLLVEPATFAWQAYLAGPATRECSNS